MHKLIAATASVVVVFALIGCSDPDNQRPTTIPPSGAVIVTPDASAPQPPKSPSQQAPGQAETFGETLQGKELTWYNWLPETNRNDIEFFALALGHEAARSWIEAALPDSGYGMPPPLTAPLPAYQNALSTTEQAKLDGLDPLIQQAYLESWTFGVGLRVPVPEAPDPKAYVASLVDERVEHLRDILVGIPSSLPSLEEALHTEPLAQYETLHPDLRDLFWKEVAKAYAQGLTVAQGEFPALSASEVRDLFSQFIPPLVAQNRACSDHSKPCLTSN